MEAQTANVIERFNAVRWHDSKLNGLSLYRVADEDRVTLSLEIPGNDASLKPAKIIFRKAVYIETDIYLSSKSMCSDDIADAECFESSEWKSKVSAPGPYDVIQGGRGLEKFIHFKFDLCVPSGTVNILATDFELERDGCP